MLAPFSAKVAYVPNLYEPCSRELQTFLPSAEKAYRFAVAAKLISGDRLTNLFNS